MNVASRNGLKLHYSTLAVMDISEAAVSAMQRPCFDGVRNFALLVGDSERILCLGRWWCAKDVSTHSSFRCVILFCMVH